MRCLKCGRTIQANRCELCGFDVMAQRFHSLVPVTQGLLQEFSADEQQRGQLPDNQEEVYGKNVHRMTFSEYLALVDSKDSLPDDKTRENDSIASLESVESVEPNPYDLCPCGSGMKYKNCHGKGKFSAEQLDQNSNPDLNKKVTSKNRKFKSLKVILPLILILAIGIGLWLFVISPQISKTSLDKGSPLIDFVCTSRATYLLKENGTVETVRNLEQSAEMADELAGFEHTASAWSDISALCANDNLVVGMKSDGTIEADGLHKSEEFADWKNIRKIYCKGSDVFGITSENTIVSSADSADYNDDFTAWTNVEDIAATLYRGRCLFSLNADGTVNCTTYIYPSMDGGDYDYSNVSGWENIVSIASTSYGIAGVKEDGTVLYEGWTNSDALLNNSDYDGLNTDDIAKLSGVKKVVAGWDHFSFLKNDGTVVSIGNNSYGQCATDQWENVADITACLNTTISRMSDGMLKFVGYNLEFDYENSIRWYQKAAEDGDKVAQCRLGYCYYHGYGIAQDYIKAAEWYQLSAAQGYVVAQSNIGYCFEHGNGVDEDDKKAVEWYQKAAEQGYAAAQYHLGHCYYYGIGLEQNYKKAVEWYLKAAEQGNIFAQCSLGDCYSLGHGVEKDNEKAVEWCEKAAEQGELLGKTGATVEIATENKLYIINLPNSVDSID